MYEIVGVRFLDAMIYGYHIVDFELNISSVTESDYIKFPQVQTKYFSKSVGCAAADRFMEVLARNFEVGIKASDEL